jgi:hypothetical protein
VGGVSKVSVLVPARNEPYLRRTIDGVFATAAGEVEVLVTLDGAPALEPLPDDLRLTVLHNDTPRGIGASTWEMAQRATGEYLMKLDAHCLLAEGWDAALKANCDYEWLAVPARWQLKEATWSRGYGPVEYNYLTYPWLAEPQFGGGGMHGKKWLGEHGLSGDYFFLEKARRDTPIDDIMTIQGSLWFVHRRRFLELGGIDPRYWLVQEAQDIGMKTWLSAGGRMVVNKKTWYAHLHKKARGYSVSKRQMEADTIYAAEYWLHDRWQHPLKARYFHWFVEHFWPIPGWPADWENARYRAEYESRQGAG